MGWDRGRIVDLLLRAGEVAKRLKKNLRREYKADSSIVTQADREIEAFFLEELEDTDGDTFVIGEETVGSHGEEYIEAALRGECYVVDPIDGTSPYAHGLANWGVSVGRMQGASLTDGAIYLPDYGRLVVSDGEAVWLGSRDEGAWSWEELLPAPRPEGHGGLIAITQDLAKRGRVYLENPVHALGAAVVPLVGMLTGQFVAYLGSVKLWDAAGGLPLLLRHGYRATVRAGGAVRSVGPEVTPEVYDLTPGSPGRWSFRSDLMICRPEDEQRLREGLRTDVEG